MLDARDWFLKNLLFLDPTLPPFGRGTAEGEQREKQEGETENLASAGSRKHSTHGLLRCVVSANNADSSSSFAVRVTLLPEPSISLCSPEGVQLRLIATRAITSAAEGEKNSVQIDLTANGNVTVLTFHFETPDAADTFITDLTKLGKVAVIAKPRRRSTHQTKQEDEFTGVQPLMTLMLEGTGTTDSSFTAIMMEGTKRWQPEAVQWYVSEGLGMGQIRFPEECCLDGTTVFPLSGMLAGRCIMARCLHSRKREVLTATKGPIIPSRDVAWALMNGMVGIGNQFGVSISRDDVLAVITLMPHASQNLLVALDLYAHHTLSCTLVTSNRVSCSLPSPLSPYKLFAPIFATTLAPNLFAPYLFVPSPIFFHVSTSSLRHYPRRVSILSYQETFLIGKVFNWHLLGTSAFCHCRST